MDYIKLSKEISYALRHAPWEYELELDDEGFVQIDQLINALNQINKYTEKVQKKDLEYIIEHSDKKRHEIVNGKIRALYGHSCNNKISKEKGKPPYILYHGTANRFINLIKENGLLPMSRQYVHLSVDIDTALMVGKRRDDKPVILEIDAKKAYEDGVSFYKGNDKVWLCDSMPFKYVKILDEFNNKKVHCK